MRAEFHACPDSGVPPGRGRSSYAIQAINCLATIVKSLRDKKPNQLLKILSMDPRHDVPGYCHLVRTKCPIPSRPGPHAASKSIEQQSASLFRQEQYSCRLVRALRSVKQRKRLTMNLL